MTAHKPQFEQLKLQSPNLSLAPSLRFPPVSYPGLLRQTLDTEPLSDPEKRVFSVELARLSPSLAFLRRGRS